jgi:cysteine desulfurase
MAAAIYLDHNATAPLRASAKRAMQAAMEVTGNASSVHAFGRAARELLEEAREDLAALFGAGSGQLVFTSGATEANNQALLLAGEGTVLLSAGEHDSLLQAAPEAERIPLLASGQVDLTWLEARLGRAPKPGLISVMAVNNETGVIQPLSDVAALARAAGVLFHCDAVQAAGKLPLSFAELGADLLSLSAHKLGGPAGCGLLIQRDGLSLAPLLRGGGQERKRRAGTENLIGIAGFAAAAKEAEAERREAMARLQGWREAFEAALLAAAPELRIFGREAPRVANTVCFGAPSLAAETQVMAMDLAGFAVSAGSACSSGKVTPSHVLAAMGAEEAAAGSAIRVSLGWSNEEQDLLRFLEAWLDFYRRKQAAA